MQAITAILLGLRLSRSRRAVRPALLVAALVIFAAHAGIAHATVYFQDNFNDGDLSNYGAIGNSADPCYTAGQYFADPADVAEGAYSLRFDMDNFPVNQDLCSYVYADLLPSPVPEGTTLYIAFWTKFSANHYWDDGEFNKHLEVRGSMTDAWLLFSIGRGGESDQLSGLGLLPADLHTAVPHLFVVANAVSSFRPYNSADGGYFVQNLSTANPVFMENGRWHSVVIRADITSASNGTIEMWINGTKVIEFHNIRTQRNGVQFTTTIIGGTHNQPSYAADVDSSKYYDNYLVTDNWQDVIDGGYLTVDTLAPAAPTNLTVQ
ncbi:MAG TPA: heparin lyase I family protein [Acidiferrobacterales bacterium]|nr:heparin lyase I family protein [Acidiferrobacterales bacterium]